MFMSVPEKLLLDTCAMIWLSRNEAISTEAEDRINRVWSDGGDLCVSVMSAWELGVLVAKQRISAPVSAQRWYTSFLEKGQVSEQSVTAEILIASSYLPDPIHNDPMDRIIIATARERDLTLVTRDRAILAYGSLGHLKALAC
jgi:PIN domain nuclease of toxin-antitoxin system